MREHQIRHLPVLHGGKLAGVIFERDVRLHELQSGMDPEEKRVREVMTTDVYAVSPYTPLDEVVNEMAAHKYGSTVVVDDGKVVGVFTLIDAMVAFAAVLAAQAAS